MSFPPPHLRIGILDSGVGGLMVLRALFNCLPQAEYIYLADAAYAPYGHRTAPEIADRTHTLATYLKNQGVTVIVNACHTSSNAVRSCQQPPFDTPPFPQWGHNSLWIDMVAPTIQAVLNADVQKGCAILATPLSVQNSIIAKGLRAKGFSKPLYLIPCPDLAPLIESSQFQQASAYLQNILSALSHRDIDLMVWGCTHYPWLEYYGYTPTMADCGFSRDLLWLDPAEAVAAATFQALHPTVKEPPLFYTQADQSQSLRPHSQHNHRGITDALVYTVGNKEEKDPLDFSGFVDNIQFNPQSIQALVIEGSPDAPIFRHKTPSGTG